ncbi:ParA family protein [Novosphingobium colocasiae]
MPAISVANPKGGAGKTTLTFVLACELARSGASVAVIDADPNAIIAGWARKRAEQGRGGTVRDYRRPQGIRIGPAHRPIYRQPRFRADRP